jgi:crotonobetainyl-CoA:carnitine CoA-transferase CaiB-like acyl-CoA transferase
VAGAIDFDAAAREPSDGPLAAALAEWILARDRADALAAMRRAGIPAAPVHGFGDLFNEPQVAANELLLELDHSQWGKVVQTGILTKFSATPGVVDRAAPLLGEHTAEILAGTLGYSADRIEELRRNRIVRIS